MSGSEVIRRATTADLDAILALERTGFDPASRWSAGSWTAELAAPDRCVLVAGRPPSRAETGSAQAAGAQGPRSAHPTAGAALVGVATFQLVAETVDLHRVVVAPEHRGHGVGRALIEAGIVWASQRQGERMLLEVEHDNAPALGLYRRLGFAELARRSDYYGPGRHALVLRRDIAGAADRLPAGATAGAGDTMTREWNR
ncbi:GNAT family N-acetyltransferase [Micropruina sp.]|uniref:GNAT family N-acetyltransferase n=1 Tax=Micropruina sp. TaxID=2737536 RepID=UPI0039E5AA75